MNNYLNVNEQEFFRLVFIIIFILATLLLLFLMIRKIVRDKRHGAFYEERMGDITTQRLCAIVVMMPAFFEFLMNTYTKVIQQIGHTALEEINYWYSILDLLFIITAILVYTNSSVKWMIFITCIVQVYTFGPSITRHINEGITVSVVNFFAAFVYYVIVACILIRVMYPQAFIRVGKVARL